MRSFLWCFLCAASLQAASVRFVPVSDETLRERLGALVEKNEERGAVARDLLSKAGCADLKEQPVKRKWNNVVCTLPGETDEVVVVGAHFDHATTGMGAVDNWSGLSLLPSLYQTLAQEKHRFSYVFVAFAEEEKGLFGAYEFTKQLGKEGAAKVHAMINIDSIGMNPPKIWVQRSDKRLVAIASALNQAMASGAEGVDVQNVGDSDSRPFMEKKIPVIDFHSVTQETFRVLHSAADVPEAISFDHYKTTYRLIAAMLVYMDGNFDRYKTPEPGKR